MTTRKKPRGGMRPNVALTIEQNKDETGAQAMARKLLEPHLRHALSASAFAGKVLGGDIEAPGIMDFVEHVQTATGQAEGGDLAIASRLLASQAMTLDAMFTELSRRAAVNMSEYLGAAGTYARLAFKAQSNCRATLEALAKVHQPREQTVRHVHVNEGGQAVVADHFHNHPGGPENGRSIKQSHATGIASECAALPRCNESGNEVPISGCEGKASVPHARRK